VVVVPYVPGGSRLGNFGQLVVSATYQLERSATPEEATEALTRIHSWASADQISEALTVADVGRSAANLTNIGAGLAGNEQEDVSGFGEQLPPFGTADVLVTNPDDPSRSFSVRFDFGGQQTPETLAEFALALAKQVIEEDTSDTRDWPAIDASSLKFVGIYPVENY
jgi:hypothetical protein